MSANDDVIQTALALAKRGCHVFPVKPDKTPATKNGCLDATTHPSKIRRLFGLVRATGVAIATGPSGLTVLDIDMKNGHDGMATLKALEAQYGALPDTVQVKTPTGGYHYYFNGSVNTTAGRLGDGLDTRGKGGYVVCPPTVGRAGDYTWVKSRLEYTPAGLPGWVSDLLMEGKPKEKKLYSVGGVGAGTRNDTLFRTGAALRGQGLPPAGVEAALQAVNATCCNPPLGEEEVHAAAQSASRYTPEEEKGRVPFQEPALEEAVRGLELGGHLHDNPATVDVLRKAGTNPALRHDISTRLKRTRDTKELWHVIEYEDTMSEITTLEDMMDAELAPRLIEGLLPCGSMSLIYAKPGVGKSTLTRSLIEATANGGTFLGRKVLQPGPVLYYILEEDPREVAVRLRDLGIGEGIKRVHCRLAQGLMNPATCLQNLEKDIQTVQPTLVVVDTLQNMLSVEDVNDYGAVGAAMRPLQRIVRNSGAHFVGVMHANKQYDSLSIEAMLGSMAWVGAVDVAIGMMSTGEGARAKRYVEVTKCRPMGDEPFGRTEVMLDATGRLVLVSALPTAYDDVVEALRKAQRTAAPGRGKGVSERALRDAMSGKTERRKERIEAAAAAGAILRLADGSYTIPVNEVLP